MRAARPRAVVVAALAATMLMMPAVPGAPARADQNDPALDPLFAELQGEPGTRRASEVTGEIWEIWTRSDSEEVNARMILAARAMSVRNFRLALRQLDQVIAIAPDFAEGWNRRATVYYLVDEYKRSLEDVAKTLKLEPRHFGALSGRGLIYMELEQYPKAVEAFRDALRHNPHQESTRRNLRAAEKELYGDPV